MSASDTAQRVIEWATVADDKGRMPPQGDFLAPEQLAHPPLALRTALGALVAATLGRLHFGNPPLDDARPITLGGIVMAAAIGVAGLGPEIARLLLSIAPPPASALDRVARHGIVMPALPFLPAVVADDCRQLSPLTAVYNRPAPGQEAEAIATVRRLLSSRVERAAYTLQLAQPTPDTSVLKWRTELLDRFRLGQDQERRFVLDVYETMMIHHAAAVREQIGVAQMALISPTTGQPELVQDALAVARWWSPLAALERSYNDALRGRYYLGYGYRDGIKLCRLAQQLTGEAL